LLCLQQRFRPLNWAIVLRDVLSERHITKPEKTVRQPGTTRLLYIPSRNYTSKWDDFECDGKPACAEEGNSIRIRIKW
jgi:hypothetical protein